MRRISYISILLLLLLLLLISIVLVPLLRPNTIQRVVNSIRIKPLDNRIIVIDPGHGGIDGGN